MKILVACEESQAVTIELRKLGHEDYSCDIEPCSGWHPEWHIQQDVIPLLGGNCTFETDDGLNHIMDEKWEMFIAFPPCTYLTVAGNRSYSLRMNPPHKVAERERERDKAFNFFMAFVEADTEKIAIENPVGYANTHYRKPDQIITPYQFGHSQRKNTCLWLKNLPPLRPTNIVPAEEPRYITPKGHKAYFETACRGKDRAKVRSSTFPGIARAMAEQWAGDNREK
jgi:hypothetical protein